VLPNYTTAPRSIDLGGYYRRLDAPGSSVYDGVSVTSATLAPSDRRIVLNGTMSAPPAP
jgi:hypothetical protein